ncbi:DUF7503 family protein [Haladaptatus pallidirubidus]|nr:hypothetical protein [Haladaptatus pallidirubidus]
MALSEYLESHPRMIGILFSASLLLMQAGTVLACCGDATSGP